jgi:hypothetical protein
MWLKVGGLKPRILCELRAWNRRFWIQVNKAMTGAFSSCSWLSGIAERRCIITCVKHCEDHKQWKMKLVNDLDWKIEGGVWYNDKDCILKYFFICKCINNIFLKFIFNINLSKRSKNIKILIYNKFIFYKKRAKWWLHAAPARNVALVIGNHVVASLIIHKQLMVVPYFSLALSNLKLRSSLKHMVVIKLT